MNFTRIEPKPDLNLIHLNLTWFELDLNFTQTWTEMDRPEYDPNQIEIAPDLKLINPNITRIELELIDPFIRSTIY